MDLAATDTLLAHQETRVDYGSTGGQQVKRSDQILSRHDTSDAADPWQVTAAKISGGTTGVFTLIGAIVLIVAFTGTVDFELADYLLSVGFTASSIAASVWAFGYMGLKSLAHQIDRLRKAIDEELGPEIDRLALANAKHLELLQTFETLLKEFNAEYTANNTAFQHTELQFEEGVDRLEQVEQILRSNLTMLGAGIGRFNEQLATSQLQLQQRQEQLEHGEEQLRQLDVKNKALNKSITALAQGQQVSAALIEEQEKLVQDQEALQAEREKLQDEQRQLLEQTEALVARQAKETRQLEEVQEQYESSLRKQEELVDELRAYKGQVVGQKLRSLGLGLPPAGQQRAQFIETLRRRKEEHQRAKAIATLQKHQVTGPKLRDAVMAAAQLKKERAQQPQQQPEMHQPLHMAAQQALQQQPQQQQHQVGPHHVVHLQEVPPTTGQPPTTDV